jgi:hypothetical protein
VGRGSVAAVVVGIVAAAVVGGGWVVAHGHADARPGPGAPASAHETPRGAAPGTPVVCEVGFKACAGECVSIDRPDVGCGSDDCTPCGVAHATARCNARHACDIAVCYQDYDNCDGDMRNGCEAEVRVDPNNCGTCGHKCPAPPHARSGCGDACTIWRCDDGFHDCNGVVADGCEVHSADDPKNCGHCGTVCGHGKRCRGGRCVP